jgi:hypothetical protein
MKYIFLFLFFHFAAFGVSADVKSKVANVGCDYKNDDLYKPEWTAGDNFLTSQEISVHVV